MIQFRCTCGQLLAAEEADAGEMTACPKCGAHLPIPSESAIQAAPARSASGQRHQDIGTGLPRFPPDSEDEEDRLHREDSTPPSSGKALASMILGLLSFCLPVVCSLPAVVLGIFGLIDVRKGKTGKGMAIAGIVMGAVSLLMCGALSVPIYFGVSHAVAVRQSQEKLKEIGIALHMHNDVHKRLPPPAITDSEGNPLLSWRVAILPYIDQANLYKQFKLDEPWDSPINKPLLARMPTTYAHPLDKEAAKRGETHYQVFVGKETDRFRPIFYYSSFPTKGMFHGTPLNRIVDGTSNTMMVVESSAPIPWTKPDDISYSPNLPIPDLGVASHGFWVLFADGSVQWMNRATYTDADLHPMITMDDGMVIRRFD